MTVTPVMVAAGNPCYGEAFGLVEQSNPAALLKAHLPVFTPLSIPDTIAVQPRRFGDARGYLFQSWSEAEYRAGGIMDTFVQDNVSHSPLAGTVRGLHFQTAPFAQAKLVTCLAGRIFDVAVDLREDSPTFRQHVTAILSSEVGNQLYVPAGFAHGFCTLEPDCLVTYRLSAEYAPDCERTLAFDDPDLAIDWPVTRADATLSDRDANARSLDEICAEQVARALS